MYKFKARQPKLLMVVLALNLPALALACCPPMQAPPRCPTAQEIKSVSLDRSYVKPQSKWVSITPDPYHFQNRWWKISVVGTLPHSGKVSLPTTGHEYLNSVRAPVANHAIAHEKLWVCTYRLGHVPETGKVSVIAYTPIPTSLRTLMDNY